MWFIAAVVCHNYGMSIRTTVDVPEDLYEALRTLAAAQRTSIRSLIVDAVAGKFGRGKERIPVTGPPVSGSGKPGPLCPDRENPYDLLFS